jgi:hypothetical protein
MRRLASLVALLLLFTAALPALACTTSRAMSREESACCRVMQDTGQNTGHNSGRNKCSQMVKQGCCRMELRTSEHPQLIATTSHRTVDWSIVACVLHIATAGQTVSQIPLPSPAEHAPPRLFNVRTTVLRI